MKTAIKAICLLFLVGVCAVGFMFARNGGVTYEFVVDETIENYTEKLYPSTVTKIVKNDSEQEKEQEFTDVSVSQTYKCNVTLSQAEWRLIEEKIGVMFTKTYKMTEASLKGNVAANNYAWVTFTPEMTMVKGNIIKKQGGKETKTYVELVYPKSNAEKPVGTLEFKTAEEKPAENLK